MKISIKVLLVFVICIILLLNVAVDAKKHKRHPKEKCDHGKLKCPKPIDNGIKCIQYNQVCHGNNECSNGELCCEIIASCLRNCTKGV